MKKYFSLLFVCVLLSSTSCVKESVIENNNQGQKDVNINKHEVIFKNDDTVLFTTTVQEGYSPIYGGVIPTRPSSIEDTKTTIYSFVGWNTDPNAPASNAISTSSLPHIYNSATYYAIFSKSFKYKVSFYNEDTELFSTIVDNGNKPIYDGEIPKKDTESLEGKTTSYTFYGWSTNSEASYEDAIKSDDLPAITDAITYYAIFKPSYTYLVTFKYGDSVLDSDTVNHGNRPVYHLSSNPSKESYVEDGYTYTFTFVGWNTNPDANPSEAIKTENLPIVTNPTTYFAIFLTTQTKITYIVNFYYDEILLDTDYTEHGKRPTYHGNEPTKDAFILNGYKTVYKFEGWYTDSKASPSVAIKTANLPFATSSITYFAIFSETTTKMKYTINFYNDNTLLKSDIYEYGTQPSYSLIPTKNDEITTNGKKKTSYTFVGWYKDNPNAQASDAIPTSELPLATADANYYAIYQATISYLVSFYNENTELTSFFVNSGSTPTYTGNTPEKESINNNGQFIHYSFVGWNTDPKASADSSGTTAILSQPINNYKTYYAIFRGLATSFSLNKSTIELDCHDSNSSEIGKYPAKTEITNLTYNTYFPKTTTITASTNQNSSNYNVEWSISSDDSSYFSIETNNDNPFNVSVTALKPSRLGSLTAKLINKKTNQVEGTSICQLRSVMTCVYYVEKYDVEKLNGISVSSSTNSGKAYFVYMYSKEGWGNNVDFVFPSMIKLTSSSTYNTYSYSCPVSKIYMLGNTDGNGPISSVQRTFRNLFIPNSVVEIGEYFFQLLNGKVIFEGGKDNIIYFQKPSHFNRMLNNNYVESFPFDEYTIGKSTSFTSVSSIDGFKTVFQNNNGSDIVVHKR